MSAIREPKVIDRSAGGADWSPSSAQETAHLRSGGARNRGAGLALLRRVNADSSLPCPRSDEDGLPRGGMLITATDYDVVYELVVRFGNERAIVTIRSRADGTATLATGPGAPTL